MSGPLIAPRQLAARLEDTSSPPTLLDVRWRLGPGADREAYDSGHIPGAVFVDLDRALADPPSERGRHPLPGAERFTSAMQAAGVSIGRAVVVYDAGTSTAAARAWWLLRYFGHPRVSVLDGGLGAWRAEGFAVTAELPRVPAGDFVASAGHMPIVEVGEVPDLAARGVLIDARAPERFRGESEPVDPVAGHIPGARNRPTTENIRPDGRFLDPASLRAVFEEIGVATGVPVAAYCGSGVTAAHEVLTLELAGFQAALYPGSWSEWIADPSRPVARGGQNSRLVGAPPE